MDSELKNQIIRSLTRKFRTFGGGQTSEFNPLVNALSDKPPSFAAGTDIGQVVEEIYSLIREKDDSDYLKFEVLDRASSIQKMLHSLLDECGGLKFGKNMEAFENAAQALSELYQEAGNSCFENSENFSKKS